MKSEKLKFITVGLWLFTALFWFLFGLSGRYVLNTFMGLSCVFNGVYILAKGRYFEASEIGVLDVETNTKHNLIKIDTWGDEVVTQSDKYGCCSNKINKSKFFLKWK